MSKRPPRDAASKLTLKRPKVKTERCCKVDCKGLATHEALTGLMRFVLCAKCALTAKEPPLRASVVRPLVDRTNAGRRN
jgi:hypothetical protein